MTYIMEWLKYSYSPGFVLLIVGTGLGSLLIDTSEMTNKGLKREAWVARILGLAYVFGSILIYILIQLYISS
jgi:hypothetical protein